MDMDAQSRSRRTGLVYLLYFLTAFPSVFLLRGIVVASDAATTAHNLLAHEATYRVGVGIGLLSNVLYVVLAALFYRLFAPVSRRLSMTAAFISVAGCAVLIAATVLQVAPLTLLHDAGLSRTFSAEQVQAAVLASAELYGDAYRISLVVFAFYDMLLGALVVRSNFLPRFLGYVLIAAGAGWLTFVWPPLASRLTAVVLPLGALAEILLMLWLVTKGVDEGTWQALARTSI